MCSDPDLGVYLKGQGHMMRHLKSEYTKCSKNTTAGDTAALWIAFFNLIIGLTASCTFSTNLSFKQWERQNTSVFIQSGLQC